MFKSWMRDITLSLQAKSGLTPAFFIWMAIIAVASLTAFAFLCVAAYDWASLQVGAVYAGLIMAGVFVLIAVVGAIVSAVLRSHAKKRAIAERAARAEAASSWLLDPKLLSAALQAGRTVGWQRVIPVALLAFLAAEWLRSRQQGESDDVS